MDFRALMRYVYDFDEDSGGGRELSAAWIGLDEMAALGIPVTAFFTISTQRMPGVHGLGSRPPEGLRQPGRRRPSHHWARAASASASLDDPLLVSVRSSTTVSMPR